VPIEQYTDLAKWDNPKIALYHGTTQSFADAIVRDGVNTTLGRPNTDFGRGFYTTTQVDQARDWASSKAVTVSNRRLIGSEALAGTVPSIIKLSVDRRALAGLRALVLAQTDDDLPNYWSFVERCRNWNEVPYPTQEDYDVVYGPVASRWGPDVYTIRRGLDQVSFHGPFAQAFLRDPIRCTIEVIE
jgi:hypothetical protein